MQQLTDSLKTVAGDRLKTFLARLTTNRFTAIFAGAVITGVVQSSSVTTVLVVGFISAGLISVQQSVGIILGANIGTSATAQLIAFKVYEYGLVMVACGFLGMLFVKLEQVKLWAAALFGLGLILFSMQLMSDATGVFRNWPPLVDWLKSANQIWIGVGFGFLITAVVQSSSATTSLVIVLAGQGMISLDFGIALIFGSNVGPCVTALLSTVGRPAEALQAAMIHVIVNFVGVLIWVWFVPQFADFIRWISPRSEHLDPLDRLAAELPRQIANAHTLFNVANALMFLSFINPLARVVSRLIPGTTADDKSTVRFLNEMFLNQPSVAIDQAWLEIRRMASYVHELIEKSLTVVTSGTHHEIEALEQLDQHVEDRHGPIVAFLSKASQRNLVQTQTIEIRKMFGVANYLENIGDIIENNLMADAKKRRRLGVPISPSTMELLSQLHIQVLLDYDSVIHSIENDREDKLLIVIANKQRITSLANDLTSHLAQRLIVKQQHQLAAFQIESRVVENLCRIHTLTRRIAKIWLNAKVDRDIPNQTVEP